VQAPKGIKQPLRLALERLNACSLGQDIDEHERGISRLTSHPTKPDA